MTVQADNTGLINGVLTIPAKTIPTGTKLIEFFGGATPSPSYAAANFVSNGNITTLERQQVIKRIWLKTKYIYVDPLAQSFAVTEPCQLSYVDLWFDGVKGSTDVMIQMRDMVNGFPGPRVIAESILRPAQITLSGAVGNTPLPKALRDIVLTNSGSGGTDGTFALGISGGGGSGATGEFTVEGGSVVLITILTPGAGYTSAPTLSFSASAGLTNAAATAEIGDFNRFHFAPTTFYPDESYCVVLMCNDAVWRARVAILGDVDGPTQQRIASQPYTVGVLFSSSNNQTWTPHQDRDLRFRLGGPIYSVLQRTVRISPVGMVVSATLTGPGSGGTDGTYPLTITGGNGSGAVGHFVVASGSVTSVVIDTPGHNYTSPPNLLLTGSAGLTGADATAVLADYSVTNCDYIGLMGTVDLPSDKTAVKFEAVLPLAGNPRINLDLNDFTLLPQRITGPVAIEATLYGTADLTPLLYPDFQILTGTTDSSSQYVSRAIDIQQSPNADPTKVTVLFDYRAPGGATITIEAWDTQASPDPDWVEIPVDTDAYTLPMADGWAESVRVISDFDTLNRYTQLRIVLTGTAWSRPEIRRLRAIFNDNP